MTTKNLPFNYKQRDPRWANQRLGTVNGTTIGSDGCYITSFAMLASFFNHTINPAQLDDLFTNNGWYVNGNLLTDDGLQKAYPDIKYQQSIDYSNKPADLGQLKSLMDDSNTLIVLEVDFNPETGSLETHFLVCTGCDGTNVAISDPWYNETDLKAHYGDPKTSIQKFVVYKGTTTQGGGSGMADMYTMKSGKQVDLSNRESNKVLANVYDEVINQNLYVKRTEYAKLEAEAIELRKRPTSCPPAGDPAADEFKKSLKKFLGIS